MSAFNVSRVVEAMNIHLVDGTYELFRCYYGAPRVQAAGREVGAVRGLLRTLAALLQGGATHVACAFDNPIESFRNELFAGYKTSQGIEPDLLAQFDLAEDAARALGVVVWRMVEFEADDALATAASRYSAEADITQVVICSPDKDLTQCVRGTRVVSWDRMRNRILDESGVIEKFGVTPTSIPDFLALVGDAADGIPGVPRWGARSAAAVLRHYERLEAIPDDWQAWAVSVRGAPALASSLATHRESVLLYKRLATLRLDVPLVEAVDDLRWRGARSHELDALCRAIEDDTFPARMRATRAE